jgi:hypothetical protein
MGKKSSWWKELIERSKDSPVIKMFKKKSIIVTQGSSNES